jgi:hypothetical protein
MPRASERRESPSDNKEPAAWTYGSSAATSLAPTLGATILTNAPTQGAYGLIVGMQDIFKAKLEHVSDIYSVIRHLRNFALHQTQRGDTSQRLATTISAKALMYLRLGLAKVDQLSLIEWKDIVATHLRATRSWLGDSLGALEKVPLEGYVKSTRNMRDYHAENCTAVQRYIHALEAYREEAQMLTGVDTQAAWPEPALVQDGPSLGTDKRFNNQTIK